MQPFHNLKLSLRLSKLRKLISSAIGKCAMVIVPPLAIGKWRNRCIVSLPMPVRQSLRNLPKLRSIHRCFYKWKIKDDNHDNYSFSIPPLVWPSLTHQLLLSAYCTIVQLTYMNRRSIPRSHPAKPWIDFHSPDPWICKQLRILFQL
jgi:hypothetical protein